MFTSRAAGNRIQSIVALGALAASALLLPCTVNAQQDPQAGGQPQGQPGQPGQPGGGRQGRGGFGNFQRQMPFATGQVTGGDPATNTIIIGSQFGGSQTVHVSGDTKMVAMVQIDVSKLKVGDTVQAQGVPKQITASQITAGEMPDFLTAGLRGGRGGAPGAAPGAPGAAPAAPAGGQPQQPQAFASATGKVTSLEPLTISLSDEISIVLKLGPNAKIMKLMPATINNIKLGDTIFASGAAGADGTFAATGLGINMGNMMGGMMGGRGGRFGGGGPGGPGGPGAGPNGAAGATGAAGGFGGGRGGRRGNRGGGATGQGGAGGAGGGVGNN